MNWSVWQWVTAIYILFYAFFSAGGIWSDFEDEYEAWQIAIDFGCRLIGAAGCLFLLLSVDEPLLKNVWKVASLVHVAGTVYGDLLDIKTELATREGEKTFTPAMIYSTIITLAFEVPCWIINLGFAYI